MDLGERRPGIRDDHWYLAARTERFKEILLRHDALARKDLVVVDLGAGDGVLLRALLSSAEGSVAEAWALDPAYTEQDLSRRDGLRRVHALPPDIDIDVLLLTDVLEHVEDDLGFLKDAVSRCGPGTFVLVSAPLHPWLWSHHDRALGHLRRYRMSELRTLVERAELRIIEAGSMFSSLLPAAMITRKLLARLRRGGPDTSDLRATPAALSWILGKLLRAETALPLERLPLGLTGFIAARV